MFVSNIIIPRKCGESLVLTNTIATLPVPLEGFEPPANWVETNCSSAELQRQMGEAVGISQQQNHSITVSETVQTPVPLRRVSHGRVLALPESRGAFDPERYWRTRWWT